MTEAPLTTSEEAALNLGEDLIPIGQALKLAGYDFSTILDIFRHLGGDPSAYFSIVNNRYLAIPGQSLYDLVECIEVDTPPEKKLMALTFWT